MARILVLGGGFCGLAAGLLLVRDAHEIIVLERDGDPVPVSADEAWEQWSREGVTQFRQAHFLAAGGRTVLQETLPDVLDGLRAAGACRFDPIESLRSIPVGSIHCHRVGARIPTERRIFVSDRPLSITQPCTPNRPDGDADYGALLDLHAASLAGKYDVALIHKDARARVHVTLDLRLPDDDQSGLAEQLDKVLDCAVKTVEKEIDADAAELKRELDVAPKEAAAASSRPHSHRRH